MGLLRFRPVGREETSLYILCSQVGYIREEATETIYCELCEKVTRWTWERDYSNQVDNRKVCGNCFQIALKWSSPFKTAENYPSTSWPIQKRDLNE